MNRHALTLVIVLLGAGCVAKEAPADRSVGTAPQEMAMTAGAPAPAVALAGRGAGAGGGAATGAGQPGPSLPVDPVSHLAYAYGMRLELPGDRLVGVMDGHAAACRDAGLRVCQLVASRRDGEPQDTLHGSLSLRGEPQWLQRFIKSAQSDAVGAAGRVASQSTTTEDLTRAIVDTEATLRARRALRDRLQQLLATRPGSLADLLSVERELSRVQGEIDSTESTLAAMRTRVAMSALTIDYRSIPRGVAGGIFEPLRVAIADFVMAAVESTAILVTTVGALLPWVIIGAPVVWLLLRRLRRDRRAANPEPPAT